VLADHLVGNIKHASVNLLIDFACSVDEGIFNIVSSLGGGFQENKPMLFSKLLALFCADGPPVL